MDKFTFIGCSFTVGEGLEFEKTDVSNYTNIISKKYNATTINVAVSGNSNYNIFMKALNELIFNTPDKLFIQWSALNRLWLYPGPDTKLTICQSINSDYTYRDIFYKKKELQKFTDMYHLLNHDYNNILTLINFCNVLTELSNKTQLIFINGLLPWTKEIITLDTLHNMSVNLSQYTKEILEFDSRSDDELNKFFIELYTTVNTLDRNLWVNMFDSLVDNTIDIGIDNAHPGPKSHALYAEMIIKYLEENNG